MNSHRDPAQHPGRECSADCAEYGCARWTAVDRRTADERRERTRRLTDTIGRGTYSEASSHGARGGSVDPLDGPHVPYPQPDERGST